VELVIFVAMLQIRWHVHKMRGFIFVQCKNKWMVDKQ